MDLVTMANEAITNADRAIKDMSVLDRTRLINSSYYMGQFHFIMGILEDEDLDTFVKVFDEHKAIIDNIFTMQEATS